MNASTVHSIITSYLIDRSHVELIFELRVDFDKGAILLHRRA